MERLVALRRLAALIVILLSGTFFITGCASPRDIRKEFEPYRLCPGDEYHVLVAAEDTSWKRDVIAELSGRLGTEYCLSVDNLAALEYVAVSEWDVVVILTTIYAFGLQSDTAAFLERAELKDRIVLLVTSSISDLKEYGVDAVSAASTGNVAEDARSLTPKREPADVAAELADLVRAKTE
jgi:hypothetical protein